jgi:GNAT superfamily N-acetyltransferase
VHGRLLIRKAALSEATALSSLAMEAKAHWGYSKQTLEGWERELEISPSDIASKPTYVGEIDESPVGFYSLAPSGSTWELDNLWVVPRLMNQGLGRELLSHALELAFRGGASSVVVDADPNAEPFYLSCGAVRFGQVAAPIAGEPDRVRPQLAFKSNPVAR